MLPIGRGRMAAVIGAMAAAGAPRLLELDTTRSTADQTAFALDGLSIRYRGNAAFTATPSVPVSVFVDGRLLPGRRGVVLCDPRASSEAVAHDFLASGPAIFSRLDGEFTLTVVDHRTGAVYLVRDRIGMRPLFWARTGDGALCWASECKLLLPLLERRRLDATGLAEVLLFRWLAGDRTLFAGIRRLLPGSYAVLQRSDGETRIETRQYWRFETDPEPADRPLIHWVEEADGALAEAVARRLAGSGRAAVLLSGGVDSPVLAQHVKRQTDRYALISPTWEGFDDPEIPRAAEYGRLIGGEHRVVIMSQDCVEEEFVRLNRRFEQPARSPHALTLARVRTELDGFDVLVHGEGADAMFGADGLRMVRSFDAKRRWLDRLGPLPRMVGALLPDSHKRIRAVRALLTRGTWDMVRRFGDSEHQAWLMRAWASQGLSLDANAAMLSTFVTHGSTMMARRQFIGVYTAVQDHMEMMDRLYAASPQHITAPFLSPEIMEVARRLPQEYKMDSDGGAKPVMKAMSGLYFPAHMAYAKKLGFPAPTLGWLEGPLQQRTRRLLEASTPSAVLFGEATIRRLRLPDNLQAVWTMICLDEILQQFGVEPVIEST